jgi:hypothetical protein
MKKDQTCYQRIKKLNATILLYFAIIIVAGAATKNSLKGSGKFAQGKYLDFASSTPPEKSLICYLPFDGNIKNALNSPYNPIAKRKKNNFCDGLKGKAVKLTYQDGFSREVFLPKGVFNADSGTISMWMQSSSYMDEWGFSVLTALTNKGKKGILGIDGCTNIWKFNLSINEKDHVKSKYFNLHYGEWVYLTCTWDKKKGFIRLYINGKLDNYYASMPNFSDAELFNHQIILTCGIGPKGKYIIVDEFKIYNRALSSSEVLKSYAKTSPIKIDLINMPESQATVSAPPGSSAIFAKDIKLTSDVPFKGQLNLETFDSNNKVIWSNKIDLDLSASHRTQRLKWQIPINEKTPHSIYIKASVLSGSVHLSWGTELAAVPSSVNYPTGLIRPGKKIVSIDCTKNTGSNYLANCKTKVVKADCGTYRETPPDDLIYFCYRFNIEKPGKMHIIRFYYPDDKERMFSLEINDGSNTPPQGAGVQTGFKTPLTGKMMTQDVYFWPKTKNCIIRAMNWGKYGYHADGAIPFYSKSAALAKVEVFEADNPHLPPSKIPDTSAKTEKRTIGMWIEDSSFEKYWGRHSNTKTDMEEWLKASELLASYLQHIGVNNYIYPIVWYDGNLFRTPTLDKFNYIPIRSKEHPFGGFGALLKIFENHKIKMYPTYYMRQLAALYYQTNEEQFLPKKFAPELWEYRYKTAIPAGNDIFQYYKNGRIKINPYKNKGLKLELTGGIGPTFNPIHPAVMKISQGIVKDWLNLYRKSKGLGGIMLDLGASWGAFPQADSFSFNRLDSGYGDYTVSLFEKNTGIKVPCTPEDPQRFQKRYNFLTSGAMRKKWIKWRCMQIRDKVVMPIYKLLKKARPDLKLMLVVGSHPKVGNSLTKAEITWKEAAEQCGIDTELYKNIPDLTFIRHGINSQDVTKIYPTDNIDSYWPAPPGIKDGGVCALTSGYWEIFKHKDLMDPVKKRWPEVKANTLPIRTLVDARAGVLAYTAYALMKRDLMEIEVGGMGLPGTLGHEKYVIPFFRAFRTLPRVVFDDIKGLEDPVRGRQKIVDGHTYLYLVNAEPYTVAVKLALSSSPGKIIDLAKIKASKISSRSIKLKMPPYSLRAFKFANSAVATGGTTIVPPAEITKLKNKFMKYEKLFIGKSLNPPEKSEKNYIWFEAEKWDKWDTKERFSSRKGARRKEFTHIKDISGGNDIAFAGDQVPTVYNITVPQTGQYTFWVRFTSTSKKQVSKWKIEANNRQIAICKTPVGKVSKCVKAGSAELQKGSLTVNFTHISKNYSYPVDCFLITDDENYLPKGLADHHEKERTLKKIMTYIKKAQKNHNTAKMRTYTALLRMLAEGIKPKH